MIPNAPSNFGPERTPYAALGGETVHALVQRFYDLMDAEPAYADVRRLHPDDLAGSRTKLYEFLSGWLGGPQLYIEKYGHPRLRARHSPFAIGGAERDAWLACMGAAMDAEDIAGEVRSFLDARFAQVAAFMVNREP